MERSGIDMLLRVFTGVDLVQATETRLILQATPRSLSLTATRAQIFILRKFLEEMKLQSTDVGYNFKTQVYLTRNIQEIENYVFHFFLSYFFFGLVYTKNLLKH